MNGASRPLRVCVDAGHGGRDPGAVGRRPFPLHEADAVLAIALLLGEEARARGWVPLLTRRGDRTLSLAARAAFANRLAADLFVSVHANAAAVAEIEGIEVYHFPGSAPGERLATRLLEALLAAFPGHRRRGVKEASFAVLRRTRMPAALVECEFLTHPRHLELLASAEGQRGYAAAIAVGIEAAARELRLLPPAWAPRV